ncbi:Fungal transcriptional regulatory protein [Beauveria brongniartii RCEF 3172]|uniref:Fungal transcriptional regulatory protein n=1 Tax=Beauveria brongniartii RCEF 3172 TaxID=1081107 RepID=A0A166W1X8_9HYPO|nr:Fungal transcriptional regulatory protein [Beauveria brongniartii RCEF 3172]
MTRSRVLDEQRIRIRQACQNCRRLKQKCDGQTPCFGCKKRGHPCSYDPLQKRKNITRIPKNDGDRYEPVAAPKIPNRSGVPNSGSSSASFLAEIKSPTEKGELNSLSSLRRLVEQIPRRLPAMGGVVGEEPIYVDMGPSGGAATGYDVPSASSTDGGVGRCYSTAPDHMDTVPVGATGIMQLGAWSAHASPSINLTHCASDAGCYGFAMQQDGYEGNAMQVTQTYQVEALEEERNDELDLLWNNNGLYAYAFSHDIARSSMRCP